VDLSNNTRDDFLVLAGETLEKGWGEYRSREAPRAALVTLGRILCTQSRKLHDNRPFITNVKKVVAKMVRRLLANCRYFLVATENSFQI
jgi:hypothetical protein